MKTRDEILKLLAREKPELERRFRVHQMALFGSYVRGDQQAGSDVDILVDVFPPLRLLIRCWRFLCQTIQTIPPKGNNHG